MKRALDSSTVLPFAQFIDPHQNIFTLKVPRQFCFDQPKNESYNQARRLFFPSLRVLPEFFNIRNLALNQEQIDVTAQRDLAIGVQFKMKDVGYPNDNSRPSFVFSTTNTATIIRQLNQVAKQMQQSWQAFPPFLVDFVPIDYNEDYFPKRFKLGDLLETWYDADTFIESVHRQSLFETVDYPGSNPYTLPAPDKFNLIRIRIIIAPYTVLTMSNFHALQALGFKVKENNMFLRRNQIMITNLRQPTFLMMTAELPPTPYFADDPVPNLAATYFNQSNIFDTNTVHILDVVTRITFTEEALLDPAYFLELVDQRLASFRNKMNINVRLNKTTKSFVFPEYNENMPILRLVVSEITSHMLGYGPVSIIDASTEKQTGPSSNLKHSYEESAFILSFDTGIIYITSNYKGGSMMVASHESFIAELKPFSEGILALASQDSHYWWLSEDRSGSDTVTLEFFMWTLNDDNQRIPFNWPCKARIVGVLKSML